MAGSSGLHWVRAVYRAGMISRRQLASDAWANLKFRLRGSTDEETKAIRDRLGVFLEGKRVRDFERLGPQVLSGVLPRLYPQMLEVAYEHQDAGRRVYICTAASQDLAEMLATVLGLDGGGGSRLEKRAGAYRGRFGGPFCYRGGKPLRMREIAEAEGIALSQSWGYSDSESDLPMLRAVGHPVAVNPDMPLLRVARDEGWQVMTFDRLRRRLRIGVLGLALGAAGAGGGYFVARRGSRRVPRPAPRRSRVRAVRERASLGR